MTVKELIEALKDYDESSVVKLVASYDDGHGWTNSVLENIWGDKNVVYLVSEEE